MEPRISYCGFGNVESQRIEDRGQTTDDSKATRRGGDTETETRRKTVENVQIVETVEIAEVLETVEVPEVTEKMRSV